MGSRSRKKKNSLFILLILVLFVSVGYALLSTTLNINGTTKVKSSTWNIYWDNPQVTTGSVTTTKPTIDSAKTTASFNVELDKPGDFYEFTIDAKNDGTIDGMISSISYKLNDTEVSSENSLPAYLNYTVTYSDKVALARNQLLAANSKETYKVRVEFKKNIENNQLPGAEVTLSLKFAVTYVQADANAVEKPLFALPAGKTVNNLTVGDEICIKGECFYFIGYNNDDVVMLAKYNLKVGNIYDADWTKIGEYTSNDTGYGLQSSDVKGWELSSTYKGVVPFSKTNYWDDNGSLKNTYSGTYNPGPDYPTVYDVTNYGGAPEDDNYSVAYYVEQYKQVLTGYGATIKDARLSTYAELTNTNIGCDGRNKICSGVSFITTTSFWVGSAYDSQYAWRVYSSGHSGIEHFEHNDDAGVRPVIVVSKNNI